MRCSRCEHQCVVDPQRSKEQQDIAIGDVDWSRLTSPLQSRICSGSKRCPTLIAECTHSTLQQGIELGTGERDEHSSPAVQDHSSGRHFTEAGEQRRDFSNHPLNT